LRKFNPELLDKKFVVSVSKADLLDAELKKEIAAEFPENLRPLFFSSITGEGLTALKDRLWHEMNE
jgi:GTP-binding protein